MPQNEVSYDTVEAQVSRIQASIGNAVRLLVDELKARDQAISQLRSEIQKLTTPEVTSEEPR